MEFEFDIDELGTSGLNRLVLLFFGAFRGGLMDNTDGQMFCCGIGDIDGIIVGRGIVTSIDDGMNNELIEMED